MNTRGHQIASLSQVVFSHHWSYDVDIVQETNEIYVQIQASCERIIDYNASNATNTAPTSKALSRGLTNIATICQFNAEQGGDWGEVQWAKYVLCSAGHMCRTHVAYCAAPHMPTTDLIWGLISSATSSKQAALSAASGFWGLAERLLSSFLPGLQPAAGSCLRNPSIVEQLLLAVESGWQPSLLTSDQLPISVKCH